MDKQNHEFGHCLGLRDENWNSLFIEELDLESDLSFLFEQLAEKFVCGDPVSFDKLVLQNDYVFSSRFVGIGGQAERKVVKVNFLVLKDCGHQEFLNLEGRFQIHRKGR